MRSDVPVEGALIWIRQEPWRVARACRRRGVVRLDVFGRGGARTFLFPFDRASIASARERPRRLRPQSFLARLAALAGDAESIRTIGSAIRARLRILPYQLEPVLAVLAGERRIVIADAVGLGKTIQAGLVIAELRRRRPALRALVIVPSALRRQWLDELQDHFDLRATPADAAALACAARGSARTDRPWHRPGVWIASIDYVKQPHVFGAVADRPWDLLVIDEAHGMCGESDRHAAAAALARRSRTVLQLTATPHNGDDAAFHRLIAMGELSADAAGPIVFRRTRSTLGLESDRRVRWHHVRLSAAETRVLDLLAQFERAMLRRAGSPRRPAALLLLSVLRKRALSTMHAFGVSVGRRLSWLDTHEAGGDDRWTQGRLGFESDDEFGGDECEGLRADVGVPAPLERSWLRRLAAAALPATRGESKLRRLVTLAARTTEPIAIFTEFRDSLLALRPRLERVRRVASLHGGLTAAEQEQQIRRFLDGDASVLLATDVASQGLNLQATCRWVASLELPWNPVRIEQRIGRVDRIGQRRSVHATLLVAAHDAERGLLERLARRAVAAQRALGADALDLAMPDDRSVRAHLLAGDPIVESRAAQRPIEPASRWRRQARAAARLLEQQRSLARRWRSPHRASRPGLASLSHLPHLRRLAGTGALFCFSVPWLDGSGAVIERRVCLVRVERRAYATAGTAALIDTIRRRLIRLAAPRSRRLGRLRRAAAARAVACEQAIARAMGPERGGQELQPGLFDRRAQRASDEDAQAREDVNRALDDCLRQYALEARVDVGVPSLELIAAEPRR